MTINTQHLILKPYAPEHLLALIDGYESFEKKFGLPAASGLREFITSDEISPEWLAQLHLATKAEVWVHGFAVIHGEHKSVIGNIGFGGPPDNQGVVEIAYGIVPDFQRRGFATEAARACISFAFSDERVRHIRAHTLPPGKASMRVLQKCSFTHTDTINDPDDGIIWRWVRHKVPA